jgi:hypothetical protein
MGLRNCSVHSRSSRPPFPSQRGWHGSFWCSCFVPGLCQLRSIRNPIMPACMRARICGQKRQTTLASWDESSRAASTMGDSSRTPQRSWAPGRSWAASPRRPLCPVTAVSCRLRRTACRFALAAAVAQRQLSHFLPTRMSITTRPSRITHAVLVQVLPMEDKCTSTKRRLVLGPC